MYSISYWPSATGRSRLSGQELKGVLLQLQLLALTSEPGEAGAARGPAPAGGSEGLASTTTSQTPSLFKLSSLLHKPEAFLPADA